ncbi:MAG: PGPGW domain-containing protein [candidate division NC10 bacterium]|nr:PGPGW domain-containing protein [candidate division NC10 bacterium]
MKVDKGGWWRAGRIVLGWVLIIIGIAGLFLPFIQGILLIIAGLAILSKDSPWARRWMELVKGWTKRGEKDRKTQR